MKKNVFYIILISHGSKNLNWKYLCKILKYNFKKILFKLYKIYISYIIKEKPYIIKLINNCIKKNIKNVLLIPIFIGKGNHIIFDLYKIIKNILHIYNKLYFYKLNYISKYNNIIKLLIKNYITNIKFLKYNLKIH